MTPVKEKMRALRDGARKVTEGEGWKKHRGKTVALREKPAKSGPATAKREKRRRIVYEWWGPFLSPEKKNEETGWGRMAAVGKYLIGKSKATGESGGLREVTVCQKGGRRWGLPRIRKREITRLKSRLNSERTTKKRRSKTGKTTPDFT